MRSRPEQVLPVWRAAVTLPLTASFCFLLVVPRAVRVAFDFADAAARFSVGSGVRALGACKPKSPSCAVALLNVARRKPV
jgi:hypothetical protein